MRRKCSLFHREKSEKKRMRTTATAVISSLFSNGLASGSPNSSFSHSSPLYAGHFAAASFSFSFSFFFSPSPSFLGLAARTRAAHSTAAPSAVPPLTQPLPPQNRSSPSTSSSPSPCRSSGIGWMRGCVRKLTVWPPHPLPVLCAISNSPNSLSDPPLRLLRPSRRSHSLLHRSLLLPPRLPLSPPPLILLPLLKLSSLTSPYIGTARHGPS